MANMKKTWITADWHLGESRFELMGRPFTSPEEQVSTLIYNHNSLVDPNDEVIVVGDVCYQFAPQFLTDVAKFNGKKTLIRGNHDRVFTDEQLKPYFHTIIKEGDGIEIDSDLTDGILCYATHYPTRGQFDQFNLVGHIHAAWKYQINMFNVGIDANCYRPVNLEKIRFHYDAICKFYDDDVWVAYNDINSDHVGFRGKKGSYFTPS
jgi:calcineurin-like phosphoesterase family protein